MKTVKVYLKIIIMNFFLAKPINTLEQVVLPHNYICYFRCLTAQLNMRCGKQGRCPVYKEVFAELNNVYKYT